MEKVSLIECLDISNEILEDWMCRMRAAKKDDKVAAKKALNFWESLVGYLGDLRERGER